LVIENLSFVIAEWRSGDFAKNGQFPGIALRGQPQPNRFGTEANEGNKEEKENPKVLLRNARFFPYSGTRKGICPQITQMDADEGFRNRRESR
jgi:hypothetical protein